MSENPIRPIAGKPTPILDGILNDLAWEIQSAQGLSWMGGMTDPVHHQRSLRPELRYLYMFLRDYAYVYPDSDFPPHHELAAALSTSVNSIARWMKELQRQGLLRIRRRGQGLPNAYELIEPPEVC